MKGIEPIRQLEKDKFAILLNKTIYCSEAILAAAYKFSEFFYFKIDSKDSDYFEVLFAFKKDAEGSSVNSLIHDYCSELIDQQIRFNLNKSNSAIKALIIKKAFFPFQEND